MDNLRQDIRYALRRLNRSRSFAAIAIITLALGIGANTAIFSVMRGVLLQPLPYSEPENLAMVWNSWVGWEETWLSEPEIKDMQVGVTAFEHIAAYSTGAVAITGDGEPERVASVRATANIFNALGVPFVAGRGFSEEEDQPDAAAVAVLSHDLWTRRYEGNAGIVGTTIRVDGVPRTVVGVLGPDVRLPLEYESASPAELWMPIQMNRDSLGDRGSHYLFGVARLKPGVTIARADEELAALGRTWVEQGFTPADNKMAPFARSVDDVVFGNVRLPILILGGAVGFVLLIACANVANLLLARGDARRREMAVRSSLGAARTTLLKQLLTESIILSLGGAFAGLLLALVGLKALIALDPVGIPRIGAIHLDWMTLLFTAGIAIVTGLVFGIVPALQLSGGANADAATMTLKEGGRATITRARRRFRQSLVIAELALSVVLVIGAGLMIRSFIELRRIDLGYASDGILTMRMALPAADYADPQSVVRFYDELQQRVEDIPGVESAGFVRMLPLAGTIGDWSIQIEGRHPVPGENVHGDWQVVTPGYFETMGIPLVQGRFLEPGDHATGMPAVVINETMAKEYWPDGNALGARFRQGSNDQPFFTVVGVVKDVRHNAATEEPRTEMYHPHAQYPVSVGFAPQAMTLVVKTRGTPEALAQPIREQIRALDNSVPVADVRTMESVVDSAFSQPRFTTWLLAVFALVALSLAAIGVFGVVSYSVSQRTHEIGIRLALGAHWTDVIRLVITDAAMLAAAGIITGVAAAAALTRLLQTLVYGVGTLDPLTFVAVPAILALVALIASWLPAHRASRVDPQYALRTE